MKTIKYSRQREAIKAFLATRRDHPTADTVYMNIRQEFPNISLGTVYRNLSLLADMGEILKLSCGDNADRFDGCTDPHYHFLCKECGSVMDLDIPPLDNLNTMAKENFPGKVTGHNLYFYGICSACSKNLIKSS